MTSDHAQEWKAAADSEYEYLLENDTWELVELPHGRKAIGCRWVFKVKYTCDGKVERFKGHLVAKDIPKNMALITMKHSHQLFVFHRSGYYLLMQFKMTCLFIKWML
jgi:hypothetical protein